MPPGRPPRAPRPLPTAARGAGALPGRRLGRSAARAPAPGGLPGLHLDCAAVEDPRCLVPLYAGVACRPLWISPQRNAWCDILVSERGAVLPSHIHPHAVFAYTLSGRWGYRERDWTAAAGDFVCEPPDRRLTLTAHAGETPTRVLFVIHGPLIRLDEDGLPADWLDAHRYLSMCRAHFERHGAQAELQALIR